MTLQHHQNVRVMLRSRPTYKGRAVKPGALALDGQTFDLMVGWLMDEDDPYPGEWALVPRDRETSLRLYEADMGWIASGDVQVVG